MRYIKDGKQYDSFGNIILENIPPNSRLTTDADGNVIAIKNNFSASVPPTINDDITEGYSISSVWYDLADKWVCLDNTAGSAVWSNSTVEADDLGTMAVQNADNVNIIGGTIQVPEIDTNEIKSYGAGANVDLTLTPKGDGAIKAKTGYIPNNDLDLSTKKYVDDGLNTKQDNLGFTPEDETNKVTVFQLTPTDTAYPSEKLVKDSLDLKADDNAVVKLTGNQTVAGEKTFTDKTIQKAKTNASLGEELITDVSDRDFSGDSGNWSGTNWTIGGGVYTHTAGANNATLSNYPAELGKTYQLTITIVTTQIGELKIRYGEQTSVSVGTVIGTITNYTLVFFNTMVGDLNLIPDANWEGSVDNISIKEINQSSVISEYRNANDEVVIEIRTQNDTNIGFGKETLLNNVSGQFNTGNGNNALYSNTSGGGNTAIGLNAMFRNTTGDNNTCVGRNALYNNVSGHNDIAIGQQCLFNNLTGSINTAVGSRAMENNVSGSLNTAIGRNAGRYIGTGTAQLKNPNQSVFLGTNTRAKEENGINEIVIGHNALGNGSNTVTIGNDDIITTLLKGNVGIGTSNPSSLLEVNGVITATGYNGSGVTISGEADKLVKTTSTKEIIGDYTPTQDNHLATKKYVDDNSGVNIKELKIIELMENFDSYTELDYDGDDVIKAEIFIDEVLRKQQDMVYNDGLLQEITTKYFEDNGTTIELEFKDEFTYNGSGKFTRTDRTIL